MTAKLSKSGKSTTFNVVVTEDLVRRLDDWRRNEPDLPNRSEAIRRLMEAALTKSKGKSTK